MNKPFNAWRVGAPYYLPPILLGIALLPFAMDSGLLYVALTLIAAGCFTLFFFRDPPRSSTAERGAIVSPADGKVVAIEDLESTPHYDGPCKRVSIFLSVFNVHVNRAPEEGVVRDVLYKQGQYKNAMNPESSDVNESNAIWIDTPNGPLTVRQISGAVARRIVCEAARGDALVRGQKIGMIKFGSRTELYLPREAEIVACLKDSVRGATTVIARIP